MVIKWVIILEFDGAYHRVVYPTGCGKKHVVSVAAKEDGCHAPSRYL